MTTVPPEISALLAELAHPNRLPILIALEEHPRSARELADDLRLDLDAAHWALKTLRKSGLVVVQDVVMVGSLSYGINAVTHRKWKGVARALEAVAATKDVPKPERRSRPRP